MSLCLSVYTLSFPSLHISPSLFLTRVPSPPSLVCPQGTLSVHQRAHRPTCGRVQRPHEPSVRRDGGETSYTHTHTHMHARKLSLHAAGGTGPRVVCTRMPLCCFAATRILAESRAPAPSLSCAPQETRSATQQAQHLACDRVQRTHEPEVRRQRERHITNTRTHAHTSTGASSLCMPLG